MKTIKTNKYEDYKKEEIDIERREWQLWEGHEGTNLPEMRMIEGPECFAIADRY